MPDVEGPLRAVLARPDFRRLYGTRLSSQFADGLFQAGLAGSLLFNPDRQADPLAVALGFTVLLLPYSLIGPFAGVLLDRWSRRHILVVANLARSALVPAVAALVWYGSQSGLFLLVALVVIGVNRFFLSGLSAALPHVVPTERLVTANSLSTTSGTVAYAAGIGAAVGLRQVVGAGDHGYALVALSSVLFWLVSTRLASGFVPHQLGPDIGAARPPGVVETMAGVVRGMVAGMRHTVERRGAGYNLAVLSAHRVFYGISTIATLLLYRNYFTGSGFFPGGELGLGQVVAAGAAGSLAAAAVTPAAVRRMAAHRWVTAMLGLAVVVQLALGLPYRTHALVPAVFLLAGSAQAIKIVTDTAVQTECDDAFVGRVFSVYDMLFNLCLIAGLLIGAMTLPETGRSPAMTVVIAAGYLVIGFWYAAAFGRWANRRTPALDAAG